jgi:hypothetical protein
MSDNSTSTSVEVADQSQQICPFMKLPTELRLRIYKFAFDDIIDDIEADAANTRQLHQDTNADWPLVSNKEHQIFVGVLSFLHTSRELRRECLDAVLALTAAYKTICSERYETAAEAYGGPTLDEHGNPLNDREFIRVHRLLRADFRESMHRLHRVEYICDTIDLIVRDTRWSTRRKPARSKQRRRRSEIA